MRKREREGTAEREIVWQRGSVEPGAPGPNSIYLKQQHSMRAASMLLRETSWGIYILFMHTEQKSTRASSHTEIAVASGQNSSQCIKPISHRTKKKTCV